MAEQHRNLQAAMIGPDSNPLDFAISENDRRVVRMVEAALRNGRLRLAWQPVVHAADPARVAYHEGLIRVMDDTGRPIPARDFMGTVETMELGRMIDCASLEMGLAMLARRPEVRIAVNMSARSIGYAPWRKILRRGLNVTPAIGERLILEITESSAMLVPDLVVSFMDEMQIQGVRFALDDFGSGFTAFRYFKDFFFDILKIDGQFVHNIHRDSDNQVLMRALLSIGRHFEMVTVAEAVENIADAEFLRGLGIDCLQGYLFGAPAVKPAWAEDAARMSA